MLCVQMNFTPCQGSYDCTEHRLLPRLLIKRETKILSYLLGPSAVLVYNNHLLYQVRFFSNLVLSFSP